MTVETGLKWPGAVICGTFYGNELQILHVHVLMCLDNVNSGHVFVY